MLIIFFDRKRIGLKEFVLVGQTLNFAYSDVLQLLRENLRRLRPEIWHRLALHLSPGNLFTKNNMSVVPNPPYFSLFPRLKVKLKGRHFDKIELIEAESQAVLNTLTEHDFQDAFGRWPKCWERCIRAEEDYFGPKLIFDQMAAPVPEMMDTTSYMRIYICVFYIQVYIISNEGKVGN
jgi:hypothetical protein